MGFINLKIDGIEARREWPKGWAGSDLPGFPKPFLIEKIFHCMQTLEINANTVLRIFVNMSNGKLKEPQNYDSTAVVIERQPP